MKRNYKILIAVVLVSATLFAFKMNSFKSEDPEKDKMLLELLTFVIEKGHYSPAQIDDSFSKGVYKDYIEALDPSKRFFLQSDIDEFSKYELLLDDQLLNKDLSFFNLTQFQTPTVYFTKIDRLQISIEFSFRENFFCY